MDECNVCQTAFIAAIIERRMGEEISRLSHEIVSLRHINAGLCRAMEAFVPETHTIRNLEDAEYSASNRKDAP
jgi:hypothetical protein